MSKRDRFIPLCMARAAPQATRVKAVSKLDGAKLRQYPPPEGPLRFHPRANDDFIHKNRSWNNALKEKLECSGIQTRRDSAKWVLDVERT